MFPIVLIVLFVLGLVGGVLGVSRAVAKDNPDMGIPCFLGAVCSVGFLIAILVVWPVVYLTSVGQVARMEAFYYDTLEAYEYTVVATGQVEIASAEAGLIDVAYQGQGQAASSRLRELRDRVDWYNSELRRLDRLNDSFLAGPFLADVPDDLQPITLTVNGEQ